MRIGKLITVLAILLLAAPAMAGCPAFGVYTSVSGDFQEGRASESEPGGASGELGNAVLAQSWDGVILGGQWSLSCPAICVLPVEVENTVDSLGNGYVVYQTLYCGGSLWLAGTGQPWGAGDADYTADVLNALFMTTISFESGVVVAHNTVITLETDVLDCTGVCVTLELAQATQLGEAMGSDFPADYPLPVDPADCVASTALLGTWWDVGEITIIIEGCTVPSAESSWGSLKHQYR